MTAGRLLPFLLREGWDQVILGDLESESLCRMAMDFPSAPLRFRFLDASDPDCLIRRVEEADIVVNCAGPLEGLEGKVAETALEKGKPYLSLGEGVDGWRQVRPLEFRARDKKAPLVYGAGASPGLTGMMAIGLARRFEAIEGIEIFLCFSGGGYGRGLMGQLVSYMETRAMGSARTRFPSPPDGKERPSFPLRHPEALWLGEKLGVPVRAWISFFEPAYLALFYALAWSRRESHPFYHWLVETVYWTFKRGGLEGPKTVLAVGVKGMKEGVLREEAVALRGDYYSLSASALYCALRRLAADEVDPGLYSLGEVVDWKDLAPLLRAAGAEFFKAERHYEGTEKMISVG